MKNYFNLLRSVFRGRSYSAYRPRFFKRVHHFFRLTDGAADQLKHVMDAPFYKKKVMSKSEYRVFRLVETELQSQRNGCRVLSQTSLGEIIGSSDARAYRSINSKRVDVLIIGPYGDPIAAIEYQGAAHHQGTAVIRDAIKKEALRKAGVQLIEVRDDHTENEIRELVRRLFNVYVGSTPLPGAFQNGPWHAP